jgi:hypothetical protein
MPETRGRRKKLVAQRARGACEYCKSQVRFAMQSFSIEHITPLDGGGSGDLENLAFACQGCNNHKYTKTEVRDPVTGVMVPLFHPRTQRWQDHFVWSSDFTRILGVTPTGRATVEALFLNREGLVNLRRALYALGEHPPAELEESILP